MGKVSRQVGKGLGDGWEGSWEGSWESRLLFIFMRGTDSAARERVEKPKENENMSNMKTGPIKVAVLGGTGNMGKHFVRQALDAGHNLRLLVRNASKVEPREHPKIEVVVGDATKPEDVAKVVAGVDVVVSCLGNVGKYRIMEKSFNNILAAAATQQKVPRCLLVTSIGCGGTSWPVKWMLILIGGKASFDDYDRADKRVREESSVPCVLVRPFALTDKPGNGKYHAKEEQNGTFMRSIPRADVAKFLVDAVTDTRWDGKRGIQLGGKK